MLSARIRLGSLWLSQVARVMADHALRAFVILKAADAGAGSRDSAWHLAVTLVALPAIVLAPFNGAICNSLAKRHVLIGSALFCTVVVAVFAAYDRAWFACLGLVAVGSAIYFPTRYALLAPAASDSHLPANRVNGLIEMGAAAAIVAGTILGAFLSALESHGALAPAIVAVLGLNLAGVVTAWPVSFRSDVRRPDSAGQAITGFFEDSRRIWLDAAARGSLLAWAAFRGLVAAIAGAFIAATLSRSDSDSSAVQGFLTIALWILVGAAIGSGLAGIQSHPRRSLGLVPLALTGLSLILVIAAFRGTPASALCLCAGIMGGLVNVPLYSAYQEALPGDARGNGMAILYMSGNLLMAALALLMTGLAQSQIISAGGQIWLVTALTVGATVFAWRALIREGIEQVSEIVLMPIYRVRGHGPGLATFPRRGPVLVIANHSTWFDPLWIGKVVPRRIIPMMTSAFYDLPILRWLMASVVKAIRVPEVSFRREAPELREAVAALDRGECVVVFPEGMLRRRADQSLRRFGQGVWHILRERPQTPVVVCWIEGGWESFTSYFKGPPATNKRLDWWRRIDIGVTEAFVLSAEELTDDDRITRECLHRRCLGARAVLGLPAAILEPRSPALALQAGADD